MLTLIILKISHSLYKKYKHKKRMTLVKLKMLENRKQKRLSQFEIFKRTRELSSKKRNQKKCSFYETFRKNRKSYK